jgi:hypothetical protein
MYADMMMKTERSPISGGSPAVFDRRVILTDRRGYATRVWILSIACGGEWSTRPTVRGFTIDVSQHRITTLATPLRRVW